jgi:steroid 5-alpha reductase family enzyme
MTNELLGIAIIVPLVIFVYMTACFIFSQYLKRTDFVDIAWGFGFVMVSLITLLTSSNVNLFSLISTLFILIWGTRLSIHISKRFNNTKEDERYVKIKKEWKNYHPLYEYIKIFLVQGILMYIISLSISVINYIGSPDLNIFFYTGSIIWMLGFVFEAVSDKQLKDFIQNKKSKENRIMDEGLWKYSRHPNYFGEITMWWGIFIISISTGFWLLTLISPVTITYLIIKVSGIPLLEKKYDDDPEFNKYKKKTSMIFPLPPKK